MIIDKKFVTIPEDEYNSIKFRKKLLIISRIIAVLLVFAIIYVGFIQMKYAKEFNDLRSKYGSNAYCYMCGLESGKSCTCVYMPELSLSSEGRKDMLMSLATNNAKICNETNNKHNKLIINLSSENPLT